MSMILSCRACHKSYRILAPKASALSYKDGILCAKCWSKPTSTQVKISQSPATTTTTVTNSNVSAFSISSPTSSPTKTSYFKRFAVGDFVYFNAQSGGVMRGQITDTHNYGDDNIFYTVSEEKTGKLIDYLGESELFYTWDGARTGPRVTGV
jgi:hypothetical protein